MAPTTLDTVHLSLPAGAERADVEPAARPPAEAGVIDERRWLCPGGLYVHLAVAPAWPRSVADPLADPLALDVAVGATLDRYVRHFGGRTGPIGPRPVAGAVDGRAARATFRTSTGEPLQLALVAGLTADRRVVTVQVTWPDGIDRLEDAIAVADSLALT